MNDSLITQRLMRKILNLIIRFQLTFMPFDLKFFIKKTDALLTNSLKNQILILNYSYYSSVFKEHPRFGTLYPAKDFKFLCVC